MNKWQANQKYSACDLVVGYWITVQYFVTARKRSLRRLCFHRCLSVHSGGVLGFCPGGLSLGGSLSGGVSVRGVSAQGALSGGGSLSMGGLCQGEPPAPMYGNEWAVRVLLECILVLFRSTTKIMIIKLEVTSVL